eukprot:CAMPEP_0205908078 /NCGR_PEP_ID=MMETSP1325-20131115/2971_1 /ASSEMBLY_ACC=CAM_ASM_000708 /TAXON_ID=236786 /ORGANISM="Florenciella sp., Strain RCC1007" /LENGTH=148 /DNA_ID=CAMNT_0053274243 /DNA_START=128 /DNA_END=571 /DNA_ORIENTATION=+
MLGAHGRLERPPVARRSRSNGDSWSDGHVPVRIAIQEVSHRVAQRRRHASASVSSSAASRSTSHAAAALTNSAAANALTPVADTTAAARCEALFTLHCVLSKPVQPVEARLHVCVEHHAAVGGVHSGRLRPFPLEYILQHGILCRLTK